MIHQDSGLLALILIIW